MLAASVNPVLVFTWGNPSRGDDGLGPALFELLEEQQLAGRLPGVDLLTDYQLQVEHALDLQGRERVLFVDASVSARAPYELYPLRAEHDASFTTHAMSPAAVLAVYEQINRQVPPPAFLLSIRGYAFGLGEELSSRGRANLLDSHALVRNLLTATPAADWEQHVTQAGVPADA
jgi:hydrogenase maturation protease